MRDRARGIRGGLSANREDRIHHRMRSKREAFGIYRPLTDDSTNQIKEVLKGAEEKVNSFLTENRGRSASIRIQNDMGVTFLSSGNVQTAMRLGPTLRGFQFGRMMESIERQVEDQPEPLEVPCYGFRWLGKSNRKLAFLIEPRTLAHTELESQAVVLDDMLQNSKAAGLDITVPDHVTFMRYGNVGDGQTLNTRHQREIKNIMSDQFESHKVTSVMLGSLVVGHGYGQPLQHPW